MNKTDSCGGRLKIISRIAKISFRKELYKYFWTMLFHRHVFLDDRYLDRKLRALKQGPRMRNVVNHRRDILPHCVIKLVRSWYPNPKDVPYMGHMWE